MFNNLVKKIATKKITRLHAKPCLLLSALIAIIGLAGCTANGNLLPQVAPAAGSPSSEDAALSMPPPSVPTLNFQPTQLSLETEVIIEGLETPVYVTHANDGSDTLYVLEKAGRIRLIIDGVLAPTPFLDISEKVTTGGNEQGLLGLAFAPDYSESGYFYVHYSDTGGDTFIARYQRLGAGLVADPAGEFTVLQVAQPARNHNGGMLAFGPDGYLYIGLGDGGGSGDRYANGQNPDTLLGKMLRIDVTTDRNVPYTIPTDNPWVNSDWNGADVRDEIWAIGLRNPWRYSFDRATGDLWIGDVGQNQYEEINFALAGLGGQNYGWPLLEGTHCYAASDCTSEDLVMPVAEYSHSGHCSVTGGYVYRGETISALQGVYLFGDYCSGVIWGTWPTAEGWQTAELLDTEIQLSSFGEDQTGELYITDMSRGRILRLVGTGSD